ncbi:hypothetical protein FSP39_004230 [Pinctada imbricata]|uniref:XK-related protein n=1 Tax=Pinctada imbricata TaxID=66713 RepID=A0AA89C0G3_PINIB|nr:hypothetical protein FSP39_004230 [Pinctada imbricata]
MLGLVDSFLESAMQLLLQLYLAITSSLPLTFSRVSSLCASLLATSLTHSAFYRVNRKANKTRKTVPYFSSFCYFLARISELTPRYLLLSLTCSQFLPWCLIAVPFHIGFVFLLYYYFKPNLKGICPNMKNMACMSRCDFLNKLFILMMSYIGLFSFINLVEGKSKKPAAIFYFVFYFENLLMTSIILWYSVSNKAVTWWTYTLWSVPIGIVCHVVFLSVFYECLHPNKRAESSVFQNEERTRISEY